jgi:hypothetical protein
VRFVQATTVFGIPCIRAWLNDFYVVPLNRFSKTCFYFSFITFISWFVSLQLFETLQQETPGIFIVKFIEKVISRVSNKVLRKRDTKIKPLLGKTMQISVS